MIICHSHSGVTELMAGDVASIACAPSMAYGEVGHPPLVAPNAHVVPTAIAEVRN